MTDLVQLASKIWGHYMGKLTIAFVIFAFFGLLGEILIQIPDEFGGLRFIFGAIAVFIAGWGIKDIPESITGNKTKVERRNALIKQVVLSILVIGLAYFGFYTIWIDINVGFYEPPTNTSTPAQTPPLTVGAEMVEECSDTNEGLIITEIMSFPYSTLPKTLQHRDEYIEIYNDSNSSVPIVNLWIATNVTWKNPAKIVSWGSLFESYFNANEGLIIDREEIPPCGYALVLSSEYYKNDEISHPYRCRIQSNTIILTVETPYLGGDAEIYGTGEVRNPDVVILYEGNEDGDIINPLSTYGDVIVDDDSLNISASNRDAGFPFRVTSFGGVRRESLINEDRIFNWRVISWDEQTPGYFDEEFVPPGNCSN